jgi:hypothetical protein
MDVTTLLFLFLQPVEAFLGKSVDVTFLTVPCAVTAGRLAFPETAEAEGIRVLLSTAVTVQLFVITCSVQRRCVLPPNADSNASMTMT